MTNTEPTPAEKTTDLHLTLLGGFRREDVWQMRRRTIVITPVGGIDLDLTEAALPEGEATVIKVSLVGGVKLTVPEGVNVVVEGFNLIGRRPSDTGPVIPGAPTVRVLAYGIFGGVRLRRTS
ncbi:LiaF domain-containing protein [Actinomadura sp. DC4]|uniref:LiaF domain-containing protein n=1 Tax=Actinomadura sp. DC4 TaxID=3055069 RepID=UPI0025AF4116|nr:LiaF domain-containing protein [Actinomadura sp. DC4]MDN3354793.1 LiaF-related protein [Actinomadura sp. DC4]